MKLIFLFIFLICCEFKIFSQNMKICWNPKKVISWNDFTTILSQDSTDKDYSASTSAGIKLNLTHNLVVPYFNKKKSWVLFSKKESNLLLSHEIRHFDIVELFARKIRYEFNTSIEKNMECIYDKNMILLNNFQERYDFETNNGTIESEQVCWNEYISNELNKLGNYKTTDKECSILRD